MVFKCLRPRFDGSARPFAPLLTVIALILFSQTSIMATAQDAPKSPAQALHQTPPFTQLPAQWIEASSGALTQGDWVRLKLAEGVVALLDGTALPSVEGWTVFGFDRDHGAAISTP